MNNIEELSYDEAYAELQAISAEMEKKDIPLDAAVKLYSKAAELIEVCKKRVAEAKLIVEPENGQENIVKFTVKDEF